MKLYRFDKQTLEYKPARWWFKYLMILSMFTIFYFTIETSRTIYHTYIETEAILLVEDTAKFTEDKLIDKIDRLNFKFPHIVLAQSKLETGNFTSRIFVENHNCFGQKEAKVRLNLALGTQYGHAYYNNYEESLLDYALWYSTYADECKTETQLYQLLDRIYAEDGSYSRKLRKIVKDEKLNEIF